MSLIGSAKSGDIKMMEDLIQEGCDANQQDVKGRSALIRASKAGNIKCVELLLQQGCDVNLQDNNGRTALIAASSKGNLQCVELLIQNGSHINKQEKWPRSFTAVSSASSGGHLDCVKLLTEAGADVNIKTSYGDNSLHRACMNSHTSVVQYLVEHCAVDLNALNDDKNTALMLAIICNNKGNNITNNNLESVRVLLQHGADVNIQDRKGRSALWHSCYYGKEAAAEALLQHGATVDIQEQYNRTPLMWSCCQGNPAMTEILLQYGADVNKQCFEQSYVGITVTSIMKHGHSTECLELLIIYSADINMKNRHNKSALEIATDGEMTNTIRILQSAGKHMAM